MDDCEESPEDIPFTFRIMTKRFFLALSIVFLGLSVLSDSADAGQLSSEIVACSVYGNNACWYLGTDGKIHNTD